MIDDQNKVETVTATEALVQRLSFQLDELKHKQKELADMLKGVFDNDEEFTSAQTLAKDASAALKDRLQHLNSTPQVSELRAKLVETREDLKLVNDSLNVHLINYYTLTGSTSFPTPDGSERDFTLQAKLKPLKK